MEKYEAIPQTLLEQPVPRRSWKDKVRNAVLWFGVLITTAVFLSTAWHKSGHYLGFANDVEVSKQAKITRTYELTLGARWMNLDGARWRNVFVCNGQSPCPTLYAEEGDVVDLKVYSDLPAQVSIHWSGMSHRRYGFWNDGTGGLNQYPILPRGNWTSTYDTTGHWGLNWYADHTGAGVADGVYGMFYVAPSPSRPRPYSKITEDKSKLRLINEAERNVRNIALWNFDTRAVDWKLAKVKAKGTQSDFYCYRSVLVNGKGRAFCKHPQFSTIDGQELDEAGCVIQPGYGGHDCTPTTADLEVIETNGQEYIMMNLINVGFEHAMKVSIDDHQMWLVATDAGFVEPQLVDTIYITNGARITVLVRLDQAPTDYAIRLASGSAKQNLESMAILRYPAKRYPVHGQPMELPKTTDKTKICLNPDSSIPKNCKELDHTTVQPYPKQKIPKHSDVTLKWKAGGQQSQYEKFVTEYFVNEKPWQLYRAAQMPVFFVNDLNKVEKPIQAGLPMGTVVDLIVQNTLNDTIPMYKHGDPTWLLGTKAYDEFKWDSIKEAVKDGAPVNVHNPSKDLVHDLPPLGWIALRWKVDLQGATMFHAVKLRYFALGMAAPLLEGMDHSIVDKIPVYAKTQPHVEFKPNNPGVLG